jgi:type VI secretion system protein ImpG
MSSFNVYYENELLALRELGREFARRNPALAPFFDTPGRDPDVERLLEGFAFLAGRLRQKLDDELPEITHALFNLLWPNYLRPIPASSVICYRPGNNISGALTIPRGTMVESIKVEETRCRFRTVYHTEILPLRITGHRILERGGEASIALSFTSTGPPLDNIPMTSLRFFLSGDPVVVHTLYFTLLDRIKQVRIVLRDSKKEEHVVAELPAESLRPVGFKEDEGLYPYPANTFPGYRILQEFFCFPEKFHFVELSGLDQGLNPKTWQEFKGADEFEIHFVMKEMPEHYQAFRADNWQLFCTPVVNLFSLDSSPLTLSHAQTEYRIVPDPKQPYHYATFSVDNVGSWGHSDKSNRVYLPFESFEHEANADQAPLYYRLRLRPSQRDEGTEMYISIVQTPGGATLLQEETISLELTCTNRLLPRALRVGDICNHADNTTDTIDFANITPVIPSFRPPLEGDLLWQLLSNMSLNYVSLTNVHALRAVLTAYDFRAPHDRPRARILEKTLQGMVHIRCSETDRIYGGLPVRGAQTRLTLDQRAFSCEGGMYLFGSILNEFFALYATVNSFHQFIVVESSRGEEYIWPARLGRIRNI